MPQSEIARIRQQIEQECQALQRLMSAPAIVAEHRVIQHKFDVLHAHTEELASQIGREQAVMIVAETYRQVMD